MFDSFFPTHEAFPKVTIISAVRVDVDHIEEELRFVATEETITNRAHLIAASELGAEAKAAIFYGRGEKTVTDLAEGVFYALLFLLAFSTGFTVGYLIGLIANLIVAAGHPILAAIALILMLAGFMFAFMKLIIPQLMRFTGWLTNKVLKGMAGVNNFFYVLMKRKNKFEEKAGETQTAAEQQSAEQQQSAAGPDLGDAAGAAA